MIPCLTIDVLVKSHILTPSRKERKINQLILKSFFLAFSAPLRDKRFLRVRQLFCSLTTNSAEARAIQNISLAPPPRPGFLLK